MSEPDHKPDGSGMDDGPWLPGKGPRAKPDAQAVFPGDVFVTPSQGAEIRNALRLSLARFEADAERYQERQGVNSEDLSEVIDTVRSALKVAEKLP